MTVAAFAGAIGCTAILLIVLVAASFYLISKRQICGARDQGFTCNLPLGHIADHQDVDLGRPIAVVTWAKHRGHDAP